MATNQPLTTRGQKLLSSRSPKTIAILRVRPTTLKRRYALILVESLQLEQPFQSVDRSRRIKSASYMYRYRNPGEHQQLYDPVSAHDVFQL